MRKGFHRCGVKRRGCKMLEVAGFVVSGIGLLNDLLGTHKDMTAWQEADLLVDGRWLDVAIAKGLLTGHSNDYNWTPEARVPTLELEGTHTVVVAHNDDKKIKYRLVQGQPGDRLVLVKKRVA